MRSKFLLIFIVLCSCSKAKKKLASREIHVTDKLAFDSTKSDTLKSYIETRDIESDFMLSYKKDREQMERNVSNKVEWDILEEGLKYGQLESRIETNFGDNLIDILLIDPLKFKLELSSSKQDGSEFYTAPVWAQKKDYLAVFNAGMFRFDGLGTSTGYMVDGNFKNNSKMNNDKTFLVFNPRDTLSIKIKILDVGCDSVLSELNNYETVIQGIRMYSCKGKNVWSRQSKFWSMVVVGETYDDEIMFAFTRSPYAVHDYVNTLVNCDLKIENLMYLEGGPEASFYLSHKKKKVMKMGSYETNFNENDDVKEFWGIPNVIGLKRAK